MIKPIKNDLLDLWEDKYGIVHAVFFERFNINEADARKYVQTATESEDGEPKLLLFDVSRIKYSDLLAFKAFITPETEKMTKAVAAIISPSSEIVAVGASFLLKLEREPFPIKIFTKEDEAIKWLLSIGKKQA